MFTFNETDPAGPIAIPQSSHSWLAWQIADHWGNRRFPRPAPRAEVLAAVLLHDTGWTSFDRRPRLDEEGRPRTFDRMEVGPHLDIWSDSVARAAQVARYAGILVADHFHSLAGLKEADATGRGDEAATEQVHAFRSAMSEQSATWRQELAGDPRFQGRLDGPGLEVNRRILAACDMIAVHLCAGLEGRFAAHVLGADGKVEEIVATRPSATVVRLQPWPLVGDRLSIHCEGLRLPKSRFGDAAELADALDKAPRAGLRFTLARPSTVGKAAR
ncbi:MAG: DUF3891 family protein [Acidobacteria bacterium]|jgi:hypothetical protein|nr:DUF3891 family protein [Acidobacteriota bacterium]